MGFSRVLGGVHQPPAGLLPLSPAAWEGSVRLVAAASQVAGCRHVLSWPRVCPPTQALRGLGVWVVGARTHSAGCLPLATWALAGPASGPPWRLFLLTLPASSGSAPLRGTPSQSPAGLCLPACELLCSSEPAVNICRLDAKRKFNHSQQLEGSLDSGHSIQMEEASPKALNSHLCSLEH